MADSAEGVVAAVAAAGGDDEVVFAAGDWVAKDDFGGDEVAFKDFCLLDDLQLPLPGHGDASAAGRDRRADGG